MSVPARSPAESADRPGDRSADRPAPDGPTVTRQVDLYGLSWSDRLHRVMAAYRLTQARLAAVIGLSAPMVSQLISGQRVKISNPAVYARVVRLEELAGSPGVRAGDPAEIARVLAEVTAATPTLTTVAVPVTPAGRGEREQVVRYLAGLAPPPALRLAAAAVPGTGLADLLAEAAAVDPAGRPT
ncbi:helix-turn-helix domain-containing protein [Nakamurella sp.]|uniref:helix-turn-helix domain-containing protein n=1 Tax=Nakamurella sp. TaxID=1869182 RepID=UPI003B3BC1E0